MDAAELAEWEAYYQVEPWGDQRSDLHAATITCSVANQFAGKGAGAKVKDFLPDFWKEQDRGNLAKMLAIGRAFAAATQARKRL